MKRSIRNLCIIAGVAALVPMSLALHADQSAPRAAASAEDVKGKPADEIMSVAEARERGRLMHKIYASTLEVMHHHYFRRDRAVLPARALEDVFADLDEQTKIKARWIAVNTQAMSIHHEPETDFEKKAAVAIAAGKTEYDRIEDGYYRRAGAIPLGVGCVGCHTKLSPSPDKTPRFAGLVISIPVRNK